MNNLIYFQQTLQPLSNVSFSTHVPNNYINPVVSRQFAQRVLWFKKNLASQPGTVYQCLVQPLLNKTQQDNLSTLYVLRNWATTENQLKGYQLKIEYFQSPQFKDLTSLSRLFNVNRSKNHLRPEANHIEKAALHYLRSILTLRDRPPRVFGGSFTVRSRLF